MIYEVIVCGSGIVGLWTAHYIAEQKKDVLLLEQFPFGHDKGSSHGPSRVFRSAYPTEHHGDMMPESTKMWHKLEKKVNDTLIAPCQYLEMASDEVLDQSISSLNKIKVPHAALEPDEISEKFPGLSSGNFRGLLDHSGGVLHSDKCLKAVKDSLLSLGGTVHYNEKVTKIIPVNNKLVKVRTNKALYVSVSVVLACGSWINALTTDLHLNLPVHPMEIDVVYWKAKDPALYDGSHFPTTFFVLSDNSRVYTTPIIEHPGLMKVCFHDGVIIDHAHRNDPNDEKTKKKEHNLQALTEIVKKHYPNLIPNPIVDHSCIYSMTPDKDFIIDHYSIYKNILIGTGFSGHGFKLSPVAGKMLGQLALFQQPSYPMHHFSIARFSKKASL